MTHWTERLYEEQADTFAKLLDKRFEQARKEVRSLLQLLESERAGEPKRVLDVACGIGRHVLAFAEEGCAVEGLDFSSEFIDRGQARITEAGLDDRAELHVHDMRDLGELEGSFDLITNFWNSMGYYDKAADVKMLTEMRQLLSEEGVVAIEMGNKEFYVKNFDSSDVRKFDDQLHVERKEFNVEMGRFETTIDVFSMNESEYEHLETMEFQPRLYAPVEMKEMCETAGFDDVSLFGGFDGEELSLDSPRLVVVAS